MVCGGADVVVRLQHSARARRAGFLSLLAFVWPMAARAQPAADEPAPATGTAPTMVPVPPTVTPYAPPQGEPAPSGYPPRGYPPPGYPGAYPGWGAPPPRWVFVDVRTDDPHVRIDRVVGNNRIPACYAPCRKMLDTGSVYVIAGDGVRTTSQFMLPDDRDKVSLDVQAGSTSRLAGGVILLGGGVAVAYLGFYVWELGKLGSIDSSSSNSSSAVHTGETMMLIGLPAIILGLYLTISARTSVTSSTGSTFTQEVPRAPRSGHRPWIALTPRGLEF